MKKKRIIVQSLLVAGLSAMLAVLAYADNGWQKNDAGQWTYYENEKQVKKQWIQDSASHWMYVNSSGIMVSGASAAVDDSYYVFDENGYMMQGGWQSIGRTNASTGKTTYTWYYAEADGRLYTDGWRNVGDALFYFDKNGRAVRGGVVTVGENKYYVDKDKGKLGTEGGWLAVEAERALPADPVRTSWYYTDEDGALYWGGWKTIGSANFYFNTSGTVTRNGVITVEGRKYYIDQERGCLGVGGGWFAVDTTDAKGTVTTCNYYANADSSILNDGWYMIDGVHQYFDKSGVNYKNRWFTLDGQKIFVDETGAQQQPGWFGVSGVNASGVEYTNWYYLNPDYTLPSEGFHEMDGHIYYFDKNGLNYRKRWYIDAEKNRYYLDEDGYLQHNGWFSITTTNAKTGIQTVSWYYANSDGSCLLNGFHELDGKDYYFSDSGVSFRKRWLVDEKKRRRYFNADGYMEKHSWFATESTSTITGPVTTEMEEEALTTTKLTWYYADENGYTVVADKVVIDGTEYKFNANGTMFTGWERVQGTSDYYYYKEDGSKALGWQLITNPTSGETMYHTYSKYYGDLAWFYFDREANGRVVHSGDGLGERTIEGRVYCVNTRGMIQYGWAKYTTGSNIRAFHYYMPVETGGVSSVAASGAVDGDAHHNQGKDGCLPGERVINTWVWSEAPYQLDASDRSATWYYLREDATVEHSEKEKIQLKNINGYHAFGPDGRTYSGFGYELGQNQNITAVYYFDVDNYNTAVTGLREIDVNGTKEAFLFLADGKGATGVYDGYLYYKGRRQTGSGIRGVTYATNEEKDETQRMVTYLVDAAGRLVFSAENLQGSDGVWSSNEAGIVTGHNGTVEAAKTVDISSMGVFIGDIDK